MSTTLATVALSEFDFGIRVALLIALIIAAGWLIFRYRRQTSSGNLTIVRYLTLLLTVLSIALLIIRPTIEREPVTQVNLISWDQSRWGDPQPNGSFEADIESIAANKRNTYFYAPTRFIEHQWRKLLDKAETNSNFQIFKKIGLTHSALNTQQFIRYPQSLLAIHPHLKKVELYGAGLLNSEWQGLNQVQLNFHSMYSEKKRLPLGIVNARWRHWLTIGQRWQFSAKVRGPDDNIYHAELMNTRGETIASQRIIANQIFDFTDTPKSIGGQRYYLKITDRKNNIIEQQNIYFVVERGQAIKILSWSKGAEAELKFLGQWARDTGAQLFWQQEISPNRMLFKTSNIDRKQAVEFSPVALADWDFFVINGHSLVQLSEDKQQGLLNAIKKGLGVFILYEPEFSTSFNQLIPGLQQLFTRSASVDQPMMPSTEMPSTDRPNEQQLLAWAEKIQLKQPRLVTMTASNKTPMYWQQVDKGRIGLSYVKQLYGLKTSGYSERYASIWQQIIATLARPNHQLRFERIPFYADDQPVLKTITDTQQHEQLVTRSSLGKSLIPPLLANFKTKHCVAGSLKNSELNGNLELDENSDEDNAIEFYYIEHVVAGKQFRLKLNSDSVIENRFCVWYWPRLGWNQLNLYHVDSQQQTKLIDRLSFYANDLDAGQNQAWQTAFSQRKWDESIAMSRATNMLPIDSKLTPERIAISDWWWFLLLLSGFTWAWGYERLKAQHD